MSFGGPGKVFVSGDAHANEKDDDGTRTFGSHRGSTTGQSRYAQMIGHKRTDLLQQMGGVPQVLRELDLAPSSAGPDERLGIAESSVLERRRRYGANVLPGPPKESIWHFAIESIKDDRMIQILIGAALLSMVLGMTTPDFRTGKVDWATGWIEGAAIFLAVFIVTGVNAVNDYRKQEQFQQVMNAEGAGRRLVTVWRDVSNGASPPQARQVRSEELVVGDVIQVSAGMELTVDALLLSSLGNIVVDEGSVTGENDEVHKHPQLEPFLISGSSVLDGSAEGVAVVCAVGETSFSGEIAMAIQGTEKTNTPLQDQLEVMAEVIGKCGVIAAVLTFVSLFIKEMYLLLVHGGKFYPMKLLENLTTAIAIVVVAVPEGLPLSVTISLAYSMRRMLADGNLVRHLAACETMGGATVLCTDKTGTLTAPNMRLRALCLGGQDFHADGSVFSPASPSTAATSAFASAPGESLFSGHDRRSNSNNGGGFGSPTSLGAGSPTSTTMDDTPLTVYAAPQAVQQLLDCVVANAMEPELGTATNKTGEALLRLCGLVRVPQSTDKADGALNESAAAEFRATCTRMQGSLQDARHCKRYPFTSQSKCSTTILRLSTNSNNNNNNSNGTGSGVSVFRQFVSGAAEVVLGQCSTYLGTNGTATTLTPGLRAQHETTIARYSAAGLRVLCFAVTDVRVPLGSALDENGMPSTPQGDALCLLALVGLEEKIRAEVPEAVQSSLRAGQRILMITGDATLTAINIADRCGILRGQVFGGAGAGIGGRRGPGGEQFDGSAVVAFDVGEESRYADTNGGHGSPVHSTFSVSAMDVPSVTSTPEQLVANYFVMDGPAFRSLSDDVLVERVMPRLRVLSRATPLDKKRLVNLLRSRDLGAAQAVVAMTGDGTNDAPALKMSDVGFAMNSGSDVAKRASDIVLLNNSFAGMVKATMWGRNVKDNIRKFLQFQLTVNLAACVVSFFGALMNEQNTSPLKPVQLLWLNLIMDTLAALALATELPNAQTLLSRPPERKGTPIITESMWFQIGCQSAFQLVCQLFLLNLPSSYFSGRPSTSLSSLKPSSPEAIAAAAHANDVHLCVVFNCFVWMQVFNFFNARLLHANERFFDNWNDSQVLLIIVTAISAMQIFIIQCGGRFMSTVPLSLTQWLFCLMVGMTSLAVGALSRGMYKRGERCSERLRRFAGRSRVMGIVYALVMPKEKD